MSMRTYGTSELGCLIPGELIEGFIKKYTELNPNDFDDNCEDIERAMEEALVLCEVFTPSSQAGVEHPATVFEAQMLYEDAYYSAFMTSIAELSTHEEIALPAVFVRADKQPYAKAIFRDGFYAGKNELVAEMKSKLERYLPDDFDWEANIGDVDYAICS